MNKWGRQLLMKFHSKIDSYIHDLEELKQSNDIDSATKYIEVSDKLSNLIAQDEAYQKQKAKFYWLKDGNINSKFFHSTTSTRKKSNVITSVIDDDDTTSFNHKDFCRISNGYFEGLSSKTHGAKQYDLHHIPFCITKNDNVILIAPLSMNELKSTLFKMDSNNSPSPYRLNQSFFKRF